jgi:hypothetical protein
MSDVCDGKLFRKSAVTIAGDGDNHNGSAGNKFSVAHCLDDGQKKHN